MRNNLIVLVKKYFDKVNGNTYHSVQFEINEKIYHSGKAYGYERQYEQTFIKMIEENQKEHEERFIKAKYIVIENCKAKELKQIHEYK